MLPRGRGLRISAGETLMLGEREVLTMDELIEAVVPGGWGLAIGVGVGVVLLAGRGLRPLAKTAIKGYLAAGEGLQAAAAGAGEELKDVYAEAKAERQAAPQVTEIGQAPA